MKVLLFLLLPCFIYPQYSKFRGFTNFSTRADTVFGAELLSNPGGEDGNTAGLWNSWASTGTGTFSVVTHTDSVRTDASAQKVISTNNAKLSQVVTFVAGVEYKIEAYVWIRTALNGGNVFRIYTTNQFPVYATADGSATSGYVHLIGFYTPASSGDETFTVGIGAGSSTGTWYIDDCSIKEIINTP